MELKERKGFLTPNQEKGMDDLITLEGMAERLDGAVIKLTDNQGLERVKKKIPKEYHQEVYTVVDTIFSALGVEP